MVQEIIIGAFFLASLSYVGNLVYKSFQAKHVCSSGCGKCGAMDLAKIESKVNNKI